MGTTSIFVGLMEVTDLDSGSSSLANARAAKRFQEIAPSYRPYPKPTQVDW
jgi:1,6-anhydro-N-acetylmuramate kinase